MNAKGAAGGQGGEAGAREVAAVKDLKQVGEAMALQACLWGLLRRLPAHTSAMACAALSCLLAATRTTFLHNSPTAAVWR